MRTIVALALVLGACACASAPPVSPPPGPTFDQKMAWILRLEDTRMLRDPAPAASPPVAASRSRRGTPPPSPPLSPDLVRLILDEDPRVRRRAALAIGRVGLREGTAPLVKLLADADTEVRQMAAFALGLIGDPSSRAPLAAALADSSPLVKGSAAEALGLIGDAADATAVAALASELLQAGALAVLPADEDASRDSPAAAVRLALYALVRMGAYDALASAVLDAAGQPRVSWWPVAFALQRLEDPRAMPALITLAGDAHPFTRAFAAKGLGAMKDRAAAVPALIPLVSGGDRGAAIEAIRSLGRLGDASAGRALIDLLRTPKTDSHLRLEAVAALGSVGGEGAAEMLQDLLGDRSPAVRSAAIRSLAQLDTESFVFVLSGLDPDPHWQVRATLASVLATLPLESALPRLQLLRDDTDQRVVAAVVTATAALKAPDAVSYATGKLEADDPVVRLAAANAVGELRPPGGPALLEQAFRFGQRDVTYVARAAALGALAKYGAAAATPLLREALADPEWAVRLRAAALLHELEPSSDVAADIRPAVSRHPPGFYETPALANPDFSTQAYIDTDKGTIQLELAMLDAPLTVDNFVSLARKGFYDGVPFHRVVPNFVIQGGDPRGDGEGGPGYTIRDELNQRPYLRGTLGMALDWEDTGGSQFFITHAPQPHLDARYTVFGRVVTGMEVVDRIEPWDVIRRVRVWDGVSAAGIP